MGDAVNLTARLMAKAEPGQIYATADVLDRSNTLFATTKLEPFAVKGKAEPVQAWSVGRAEGSRTRQVTLQRLPLTGRNAELGVIRKAFTSARSGAGRLIEVVGDAGIGKTRLLEALRDAAAGFNKQHATCEAYTVVHPVCRLARAAARDARVRPRRPDADIAERIRAEVADARRPTWRRGCRCSRPCSTSRSRATPEVEHARGEQPPREAARNRRPVPRGRGAREAVDRDRRRASHGRGLRRTPGAPDRPSSPRGPGCSPSARRASGSGFEAPEAPEVVRIELKPLAPQDALRLAQLATEQTPLPPHVLEVVAKRSGGNPQFLRDLLRTAIESGGVADLPDPRKRRR